MHGYRIWEHPSGRGGLLPVSNILPQIDFLKSHFVYKMMLNALHDSPFNQTQLLNSAADQYITVLENKILGCL